MQRAQLIVHQAALCLELPGKISGGEDVGHLAFERDAASRPEV